jgi:hypothetical protein
MNPVKKHPVLGGEFVDEGDDETLDAALSGVDRGLAEKKRREAEKESENEPSLAD